MKIILPILAYLFSALLGYLSLRCLLRPRGKNDLPLIIFLAPGAGLAITAFILFYSFLFLDRLSLPFAWIAHGLALCGLLAWYFLPQDQKSESGRPPTMWDIFSWAALALLVIPLGLYAQAYPMGGWDAWQVWNLKAKFLYLGGEDWKSILDPSQWRSSPHYPIFLPLVIVWGWIWTGEPAPFVPLCVSILFTFSTAALLYGGLRRLTQSRLAILPALLLLTLPLYVQLGTSQYADIVLSYYLLAALFCSLLAHQTRRQGFVLLAGGFLGVLSFIKPEGAMAALILVLLNILFLSRGRSWDENERTWFGFIGALFIFALPTALFALLYSPGNQTFINGLVSAEKPSQGARLGFTLVAFFISMISRHWHALWLIILAGVVIGWRKAFKREILIVPLFLLVYTAMIIFYYWMNTYFEISWWMKNTVARILLTLLPVALLWAFCAVRGIRKTEKE